MIVHKCYGIVIYAQSSRHLQPEGLYSFSRGFQPRALGDETLRSLQQSVISKQEPHSVDSGY